MDDLKALALAAAEARKVSPWTVEKRFAAQNAEEDFQAAATPERILQYRNDVLSEAQVAVRRECGACDNGNFGPDQECEYCGRPMSVIETLKTPEPT